MFARSLFRTADMERQGRILAELSGLVDNGTIRTTLNAAPVKLTAENVRQAHLRQRSGSMVGKQVLFV
jgi:NADPH:quinone reductase-like Zn-dependent oxidoreductase